MKSFGGLGEREKGSLKSLIAQYYSGNSDQNSLHMQQSRNVKLSLCRESCISSLTTSLYLLNVTDGENFSTQFVTKVYRSIQDRKHTRVVRGTISPFSI